MEISGSPWSQPKALAETMDLKILFTLRPLVEKKAKNTVLLPWKMRI